MRPLQQLARPGAPMSTLQLSVEAGRTRAAKRHPPGSHLTPRYSDTMPPKAFLCHRLLHLECRRHPHGALGRAAPAPAHTCGRVCTTKMAPSAATQPSTSCALPSASSIAAPVLATRDSRSFRNPSSASSLRGRRLLGTPTLTNNHRRLWLKRRPAGAARLDQRSARSRRPTAARSRA